MFFLQYLSRELNIAESSTLMRRTLRCFGLFAFFCVRLFEWLMRQALMETILKNRCEGWAGPWIGKGISISGALAKVLANDWELPHRYMRKALLPGIAASKLWKDHGVNKLLESWNGHSRASCISDQQRTKRTLMNRTQETLSHKRKQILSWCTGMYWWCHAVCMMLAIKTTTTIWQIYSNLRSISAAKGSHGFVWPMEPRDPCSKSLQDQCWWGPGPQEVRGISIGHVKFEWTVTIDELFVPQCGTAIKVLAALRRIPSKPAAEWLCAMCQTVQKDCSIAIPQTSPLWHYE